MPRQFAYRGDRLAYSWGIILLAAVAAFLHLAVQRQRHRPDPALLGRRVRVLHAQPDRDGQALADGHGVRLGWRVGGQRLRRRPDGGRPRRRRQRQVRRRRVSRRDPDPDPRRDDAVHPPPVRRVAARARRPPATSSSEPPHREERVVVPIPGVNRAVIQAVNVGRSIADDVRAVFITEDAEDGAADPRALGAPGARACRWSSSSRRTGR